MVRPLFETQGDLAKERAVIERVVGDKFEVRKLPIKYQADFGLFENSTGNLKRWVEVRCRTTASHAYPTLIVSLDKIMAAENLVRSTGIPFVFMCEWTDTTGTVRINKASDYDIKWGGRNELRDWQDVEPVCHIPISHFKMINNERQHD